MVLLPLLLVLQAGSPSVGVPGRAAGELPVRVEKGRNVETRTFALEPGAAKVCTVHLTSVDFDPRLVVHDDRAGGSRKTGERLGYWDEWIVIEDATDLRRRLAVESEDDRGGRFTITVHEGKVLPSQDAAERARIFLEAGSALAASAEARSDWSRAARIRERTSQAAFRIRNPARAREQAELGLRDAESAGDAELALRSRINLGEALRLLDRRQLAEETLRKAAESVDPLLAKAAGGEGEADLALFACRLFDNLGDLEIARGAPGEAEASFRKLVEIAPRSKRIAIESVGWSKLGFALDEGGKVAEARAAVDKGLEIAEKEPKNVVGIVSALLSRGRHLAKRGPLAESKRACEKALALEPPDRLRIELLGVVSGVYLELGRFEKAEAAMDELEALCAKLGITEYAVPTAINKAAIAFRLGEVDRAREMLEALLESPGQPGGPGDRIEILTHLGVVDAAAGRGEPARKRLEEALEACEAAGDRSREAHARIDLAILHEEGKDHALALAELDRAAELGDERTASIARAGRAWVLYRQGDMPAAREVALRESKVLADLGERRAAIDAQDTLASIALATGDVPAVEAALCAADELLEELDAQVLDPFETAGMRSGLAHWGAIAQDLAALKGKSAAADTAIAEGWSRAGRWKGRVLLERMHAGRADAQPQILEGSAIVEYAEGLEKLYAYVATADALRFLDLGERETIEEKARALAQGLADRALDPEAYAAAASELYRRLVEPWIPLVPSGGKARITIVPTPALATLPFEALVVPASAPAAKEKGFAGLRCLIDEHEVIAHAPSTPVLARLESVPPRSAPRRFLIVGDPIYRQEAIGEEAEAVASASRPGSDFLDYGRLKGTREEARELANLLLLQDPGATDKERAALLEVAGVRSAKIVAGTFDLHLGSASVLKVLQYGLANFSHLHLATHGHVDVLDPRRSGLLLGYEPETQGLLGLEDVLAFRLDAELVVLSACDTARGRIVRGEGVQSLANVFLEAGSRAVIASLWKIEDGESAEIMSAFYGAYLRSSLPPADALRHAKLEFRRSKGDRGLHVRDPKTPWAASAANPYYWAPFVYVGPTLR